jgi:hypothetical protein
MRPEFPSGLGFAQPPIDAARRALGPVQLLKLGPIDLSFLTLSVRKLAANCCLTTWCISYLSNFLASRIWGSSRKIAWSVPVDFNGRAFLIEHRKFGVGVIAHDPETEEESAREIVSRMKKGVSIASPFFDWLAKEAVAASALSVVNNSDDLFRSLLIFGKLIERKRMKHSREKMKGP